MGIEFPEFFASLRVESKNVVVGRGEEELSVHEDGSGFEGSFAVEIRVVGKGSGVKSPGKLELGHVGFVDLSGGGEARAASVAAVSGPGCVSGFLREEVCG